MPERIDDEFFDALTAGDARRPEALLEERFLIVDAMSGAVADRAALVAALDGRVLEFERVDFIERAARDYGDTAILVGRTQMAGSFAGAPSPPRVATPMCSFAVRTLAGASPAPKAPGSSSHDEPSGRRPAGRRA